MAVLVPSRPSESSSHLIISTGLEAYRMQRAKPSSSSTIQDLVMAQLSPRRFPALAAGLGQDFTRWNVRMNELGQLASMALVVKASQGMLGTGC